MTTPVRPLRVAAYNLAQHDDVRDSAGDRATHEAIRSLLADVLIVAGITVDRADRAARRRAVYRRVIALAEAVDMQCHYEPDQPTVAVGRQRSHSAILWRSGITAGVRIVPVRWQVVTGPAVQHAAAVADLDLAGTVLRLGAYYATAHGPHAQATEAHHLAAALTGDPDRPPVLLAATEPIGTHTRHADTTAATPTEVLYTAGLVDAAVATGAPWTPTIGPWPGHLPPPANATYRLDHIYTTHDLQQAVTHHTVVNTTITRSAGQHLPVTVDIQPANIASTRHAEATGRLRCRLAMEPA